MRIIILMSLNAVTCVKVSKVLATMHTDANPLVFSIIIVLGLSNVSLSLPTESSQIRTDCLKVYYNVQSRSAVVYWKRPDSKGRNYTVKWISD